MSRFPSLTANYEAGNPAHADSEIINSFGTMTGPGTVNRYLATVGVMHALDHRLPIMADRTIVPDIQSQGIEPDFIAEGPISNLKGTGIGTWGVWELSKVYMEENSLSRPLIIAQAFHAHRVALQGIKQGISPVIAPDLPRHFDADSEQPWTQSRPKWMLFSPAIGMALRMRGQL